jgi:hypothetical protein
MEVQGDDAYTNFLPRLYWQCQTCRYPVGSPKLVRRGILAAWTRRKRSGGSGVSGG